MATKVNKSKMACNKPKRTPSHPKKSHVVKACKDGKEKIIRFGQQGVKGAGKNPKSAKRFYSTESIRRAISGRRLVMRLIAETRRVGTRGASHSLTPESTMRMNRMLNCPLKITITKAVFLSMAKSEPFGRLKTC